MLALVSLVEMLSPAFVLVYLHAQGYTFIDVCRYMCCVVTCDLPQRFVPLICMDSACSGFSRYSCEAFARYLKVFIGRSASTRIRNARWIAAQTRSSARIRMNLKHRKHWCRRHSLFPFQPEPDFVLHYYGVYSQ